MMAPLSYVNVFLLFNSNYHDKFWVLKFIIFQKLNLKALTCKTCKDYLQVEWTFISKFKDTSKGNGSWIKNYIKIKSLSFIRATFEHIYAATCTSLW